ncbi:MAG: DUF3857 domain-containing protein [Bacteroidetes bacterium]|nr:MAG: DUF3857 domain-containing protein [Bacteroidota bacterium]TAG86245.1 MAG: DUF3857 domain-containing protein [Bacteroidota bacterium]
MQVLLLNSVNKWKVFLFLFIFSFISSFSFANEYQDAWEAIRNNDLIRAKTLLIKALDNPKTSLDACMLLVILDNQLSKKANMQKYVRKVYDSKNPEFYPNLYALLNNKNMLGDYGKKTPTELKFMQDLLKDDQLNGTLRTYIQNMLGEHYLSSNDLETSQKEEKKINSIYKWQFVGGFDNLIGSGFDKDYAPIYQTKGEFISSKNAKISWFSPSYVKQSNWISFRNHIIESTAISYAQTFVETQNDTEVILCAGVSGTIKVWLNDRLILSESEDRSTGFDAYKTKCTLKKGFNRLVVQIGYLNDNNPHFMIRLADKNLNDLNNLTYSDQVQNYTSEKNLPVKLAPIKHFAEEFFEQKIKSDPTNLLYPMLLCDVYLRNKKVTEARHLLQPYVEKEYKNYLVRFYLLFVLSKSENRTDFTKELNAFKESFPNSMLSNELKYEQYVQEEKYKEAQDILNNNISNYGMDEEYYLHQIKLFANQRKNQEFVAVINKAYEEYPDELKFVTIYYNIQKEMTKDPKKSLKIYEKYFAKNYNYKALNAMLEAYTELGTPEKSMKVVEKMHKLYPNEIGYLDKLAQYHYSKKNYKEAINYIDKILELCPYSSYAWKDLGTILEEDKQTTKSLEAYKKSLYYQLTDYSTRRKIREIEQKTDLLSSLPEIPVLENIKNSKIDDKIGQHDWYYILDEKQKIIYPEGATEEYFILAVKIVNQKGVDYWHQSSLPYNPYSQRLMIVKAEAVKKNGTKIDAETSGNDLVFTNLEPGDAIYIKYKTESYQSGRMAKDFWDKFIFNSSTVTEQARYSLLLPSDKVFQYKLVNGNVEPTIKELGDYKLYVWESKNIPALKKENFTPALTDIANVLYLSSLSSWKDIVAWYHDISTPQAKDDFEVEQAYNTIFNGKTKLSNYEKLRSIYDYIVKNIQYSSVSFRQSGFVPQTASKTLQTKLGDCKDVSTLYATLARKAGFKVDLCLVSTRDNGKNDLILPAIDFNHCIVKVNSDNKDYYLELTNSFLPFASLPAVVEYAQILEIPFNVQDIKNEKVKTLESNNTTNSKIKRIIDAKVENRDWKFHVKTTRYGGETYPTRNKYGNITPEKQKEAFEESIANDYKNPISVESVKYPKNLNTDLSDSLDYEYTYSVKNEILEIGSLKTFKVPYADIFANINSFTEKERQHRIEFWKYQDTPEFEEVITVSIPQGTKLIDIPQDVKLEGKVAKVEFYFKKIKDDTLKITKKTKLTPNAVVLPQEYDEFKKFLTQLSDIEGKYVTFK